MTNYTQEQYERDKQIVAKVPEGFLCDGHLTETYNVYQATHITSKSEYMYYSLDGDWYEWDVDKSKWILNESSLATLYSVRCIDDIREKIALYEQNQRLRKACERIRDDLLMRADIHEDGTRAVNVSFSVWDEFCEALDNAHVNRRTSQQDETRNRNQDD